MMTKDEATTSPKDTALKLALEALEDWDSPMALPDIYAIKEALAQPDYRAVKTYHEGKPVYVSQPEQEPVAWRNAAVRIGEELSSVGPDSYYNMTAQQWLDWAMEQKPRGKNSLAQPSEPRNFCPRCGKRTADLTVIHTCTPPRGLEMT